MAKDAKLLFKDPEGLTRSSLLFFFFCLSVVSLSFKHGVSALTFGKQGLLITVCWIPVKTLQLVSKAYKVLEAREHNASTYFQISFTPIFAVLRKMVIMSKFLSHPFTPIQYVLYSCIFSQVREQKLMLLTRFLLPAARTKGCTLSQVLPRIHFFFMCNWVEGRKGKPGLCTITLLPPPDRPCSSTAG